MVANFFKAFWIRIVIGVVLALALYFTYLGIKNGWNMIALQCDACFMGGLVTFGVGGLCLVLNLGGFDIFTYLPGRRKQMNGIKEDMYAYSKRKKEERSRNTFAFLAYFIAATPFLLAAVVLLIIIG